MMNILIINGPNLNLLGTRDTGTYGNETLIDVQNWIAEQFPNYSFSFFQSNVEGELINKIQEALKGDIDGLIVNLGGYSHTSVALRDALDPISIPKVEVHISNIHARESFREQTITGSVMDGIITGFGKNSYLLGVQAIEHLSKNK